MWQPSAEGTEQVNPWSIVPVFTSYQNGDRLLSVSINNYTGILQKIKLGHKKKWVIADGD